MNNRKFKIMHDVADKSLLQKIRDGENESWQDRLIGFILFFVMFLLLALL